ncbi:MAG: hypothetical protein IPN17_18105 [Deltaproteobacteria bacterium]|nr:hypothetical protein [Deltaproteobacteria bacterium]
MGAPSECDAFSRSRARPPRWYAIVAALVLGPYLHDDIAWADPLDEPWRIARADPLSRLRSVELSRRRGGLWAIVRARLEGGRGLSEVDRSAEDEALLSLLAQEPDLSARLTALTALALPLGRDTRSLAARVEALRLPELAPPALALAALHAVGTTESLLDAARARGSVVPDDELAAVALDALATRQYAELEGRTVEEPLSWRIQARRRDPARRRRSSRSWCGPRWRSAGGGACRPFARRGSCGSPRPPWRCWRSLGRGPSASCVGRPSRPSGTSGESPTRRWPGCSTTR